MLFILTVDKAYPSVIHDNR